MSYNAKKSTSKADSVAGATRRTLRQVQVNVRPGKVGETKIPGIGFKRVSNKPSPAKKKYYSNGIGVGP